MSLIFPAKSKTSDPQLDFYWFLKKSCTATLYQFQKQSKKKKDKINKYLKLIENNAHFSLKALKL